MGRAEVVSAALGDQHSLFLDSAGGLWTCGENKEGQCGLGTPIEVLAAQHRRAYYEGLRTWESLINQVDICFSYSGYTPGFML